MTIDRSLYLPFEDAHIACVALCECGLRPGSCECDSGFIAEPNEPPPVPRTRAAWWANATRPRSVA